jgi:hypothetical protein
MEPGGIIHSNALGDVASHGTQVDQGHTAQVPLAVLATRRAQKDAGDVISVPSVILATRRAQMDQEISLFRIALVTLVTRGHRRTMEMLQQHPQRPGCHRGTGEAWRVSAVPPEDGVTEAITVNHDTALAVYLRLMTTSQLICI